MPLEKLDLNQVELLIKSSNPQKQPVFLVTSIAQNHDIQDITEQLQKIATNKQPNDFEQIIQTGRPSKPNDADYSEPGIKQQEIYWQQLLEYDLAKIRSSYKQQQQSELIIIPIVAHEHWTFLMLKDNEVKFFDAKGNPIPQDIANLAKTLTGTDNLNIINVTESIKPSITAGITNIIAEVEMDDNKKEQLQQIVSDYIKLSDVKLMQAIQTKIINLYDGDRDKANQIWVDIQCRVLSLQEQSKPASLQAESDDTSCGYLAKWLIPCQAANNLSEIQNTVPKEFWQASEQVLGIYNKYKDIYNKYKNLIDDDQTLDMEFARSLAESLEVPDNIKKCHDYKEILEEFHKINFGDSWANQHEDLQNNPAVKYFITTELQDRYQYPKEDLNLIVSTVAEKLHTDELIKFFSQNDTAKYYTMPDNKDNFIANCIQPLEAVAKNEDDKRLIFLVKAQLAQTYENEKDKTSQHTPNLEDNEKNQPQHTNHF